MALTLTLLFCKACDSGGFDVCGARTAEWEWAESLARCRLSDLTVGQTIPSLPNPGTPSGAQENLAIVRKGWTHLSLLNTVQFSPDILRKKEKPHIITVGGRVCGSK